MSGFNRRFAQKGSTDSYRLNKLGVTDEHGRVFTLNYTGVFATVSALLTGAFFIYTALHYITPYFSNGDALRIGGQDTIEKIDAKFDDTLTERLLHSFKKSEVFVPKGRYIQIEYTIPRGATIDVTLTRCKGIPVVEVFNCTPTSTQTETISGKSRGMEKFRFGKSGFYAVQHKVNLPATPVDKESAKQPEKTTVLWRRGQ